MRARLHRWVVALALATASAGAQVPEPPQEETTEPSSEDRSSTSQDATGSRGSASPPSGSKSGYEEVDPIAGASGVGSQLVSDDQEKGSLVKKGLSDHFYQLKRRLMESHGLEVSADYNILNQWATESSTDTQASSGSIRAYGRWTPNSLQVNSRKTVVFRFENRHRIGPGITPRDLGFDGGSALSTASFKDFDWGLTSLYWQQANQSRRMAYVVGQMDPGDFEDLHPLLNAWTAFMNDASFNNPTTTLPQQGLGIVGRWFFLPTWYVVAGVNDVNGKPSRIDFESFFSVRNYFTWAEIGWAKGPNYEAAGASTHVTAWHSDESERLEQPSSWGVTFSSSFEITDRLLPFVRLGYSEGEAPLLSRMVSAGIGIQPRGSDLLGLALTWGRPPAETEGPDQITFEGLYRIQLHPNIQVTPGLYWTRQPEISRTIWTGSVLRVRFVL